MKNNENKIKDIALKQQKYFIITSITKLITEQSLVCNISNATNLDIFY